MSKHEWFLTAIHWDLRPSGILGSIVGSLLPTLLDVLSVPSVRTKQPTISIRYVKSQKERRSYLHHGGNLKSRTAAIFCLTYVSTPQGSVHRNAVMMSYGPCGRRQHHYVHIRLPITSPVRTYIHTTQRVATNYRTNGRVFSFYWEHATSGKIIAL